MIRNPILKKELVLGARTIKLPTALMIYSGIMAGAAMGILNTAVNLTSSYYGNVLDNYNSLTTSFTLLAVMQLVMICVIVPILTAGSIAGERERQTLDIMLTAPISSFSIVMGKLWSAIFNVFLFIICSLPAMSICFLYGGMKWNYLGIFLVCMLCIAFFDGAIGVWCSARFRKTIVAVIMTMVIELVFYIGTLVAFVCVYVYRYEQLVSVRFNGVVDVGPLPLILLLNPAVGFCDTIFAACTGTRIVDSMLSGGFFGSIKMSDFISRLIPYWNWISFGVTILLGLYFVMIATSRVNSVNRKEKHVKVKEKKKQKKRKKRE